MAGRSERAHRIDPDVSRVSLYDWLLEGSRLTENTPGR